MSRSKSGASGIELLGDGDEDEEGAGIEGGLEEDEDALACVDTEQGLSNTSRSRSGATGIEVSDTDEDKKEEEEDKEEDGKEEGGGGRLA